MASYLDNNVVIPPEFVQPFTRRPLSFLAAECFLLLLLTINNEKKYMDIH